MRVAWVVGALAAAASLLEATPARADVDEANLPLTREVGPPPVNTSYVQYGIAFTGEAVASAGPMCDVPTPVGGAPVPCVFGSGGGIAIRVGWRNAGPWYLGGTYELTKQDPNKIFRLAILQQLRAEGRYYLYRGVDTQPYGSLAVGLAGYGNLWGIDTAGPLLSVGVGAETQISRRMVFGLAIAYRAMYFTPFTDSSQTGRPGGIAHVVAFDFSLEARDPL
jgi:hypothetical protein